jgi:hypothetical protein
VPSLAAGSRGSRRKGRAWCGGPGLKKLSLNPRLAEARDKVNAASMAAADAFAANVRPIIEQIRASGVQSFRGIARALTARGVKTARGGQWSAAQVSDIVNSVRPVTSVSHGLRQPSLRALKGTLGATRCRSE